ncbi:MAG TPA: hypothetical protein VHN14_36255 [Kofleriaceae bacterium]|jgi:hypothetical protein|nr:hypothetical protein [Kofleriaceae bacterium]
MIDSKPVSSSAPGLRLARTAVIDGIGLTVLVFGFALIVLPGPAQR